MTLNSEYYYSTTLCLFLLICSFLNLFQRLLKFLCDLYNVIPVTCLSKKSAPRLDSTTTSGNSDTLSERKWVAESTTMISQAQDSIRIMENNSDIPVVIYRVTIYYLPVPKREVSMLVSLGLKPLNRQMNVSLRLWDISRTFIR